MTAPQPDPPQPTPTPAPPPEPQPDPPPDDDDGGESLTERESRYKREAVARRRETRAAQQENDKLRAELERVRGEQETEADRRIREAVEAAKGETAATYERRLLEASVLTRAAGRLAHPEVAAALLPIDEILAEPADVREVRLDEEIDALLAKMPELALVATPNGAPPLVTQGVRTPRPTGTPGDDPDAWIRARAKGNR